MLNAVFAQKIMNTSYADSVSFGETYTDQNIYSRDTQYTIKDSGRFNQPLDRITTSDYITPPLEMVGTYMYMNIIVQIDIKEVYDGYQWFYLYNGVNVNCKLISETQFEHYPGEANTSYKTYTLKFDGVPLSMLETNDLVIRYGASGNKSDDWCNKNIKVRIEYVNLNEKLLLNMKYPENISAGETKEYTCYIPDSLNYVVETRGELDTYLIVEGLSTGTVENDNSGVGNNASIGFKGENKWITIKLRCKNSADFGTTEIQIRKQQASLFGFDYGTNDINTTSDLNEPYNNLRTMYDTRRFCEGTESSPSYMLSNDARGYPRMDSEIVFFSGHGKEGLISLPNGRLYSYNLCSMENTKIAVWSACHSSLASATADSILTASIKAGAKAGVGRPDKIPVSSARKFTNKLFSELVGGSTLQSSCITAASEISLAIDPILNWKIEGNRQITISKEIPNKLSNSLETAVKINAFNERYTETDD